MAATMRRFAAVAALIGWGALILQFYLTLRLAVANGKGIAGGVVVYFGYFTILTNILAALALSAPLLSPSSTVGAFFGRPGVNSAIATAIAMVGLVYSLLLRKIWDPHGLQLLTDEVLHDVMPILFLIYWWFAVPVDGVRWSDLPKWLLYPIGYFVYTLVRGPFARHYPYPFLDPGALGHGRVLVNAGILVASFLVIAGLLLGARHLLTRARASARVPQ
jgi:hypothetical protein